MFGIDPVLTLTGSSMFALSNRCVVTPSGRPPEDGDSAIIFSSYSLSCYSCSCSCLNWIMCCWSSICYSRCSSYSLYCSISTWLNLGDRSGLVRFSFTPMTVASSSSSSLTYWKVLGIVGFLSQRLSMLRGMRMSLLTRDCEAISFTATPFYCRRNL